MTSDYTAESARLVKLLEDTYSEEEITKNEEPVFGGAADRAVLRHRIVHDQTQYDCEDRRSVTGRSVSIATFYSSGGAAITGTFTYPDDMHKRFIERRSTACTEFDHNKSWTTWNIIAPANPFTGQIKGGICKLESTTPTGSAGTSCSVLNRDRVTVIITGSEYESSSGKKTNLGNIVTTTLIIFP